MEIIYRSEQVDSIAGRLNINKNVVNLVINNYVQHLVSKINSGETVKFLNICYLRVSQKQLAEDRETLAYIATEIGSEVGVGGPTVLRILLSLEELICYQLLENRGFSIRYLVRIRMDDETVRVKKSTSLNGKDVYAVVLGSFRRKMLELVRRNAG